MTQASGSRLETQSVRIPADGVHLAGDLTTFAGARGTIVFAHGSGSSRSSPRNRAVARQLQLAGFGTLLFDLLTIQEEAEDAVTRRLRFDIGLLASRLGTATRWLATRSAAKRLPLGYFGASTGAAAALVAAARHPELVNAVVSRGGRPDLAGSFLRQVTAPTLLVVGGDDTAVIRLNQLALAELGCRAKELAIVPHATHLFEEPGALEQVANLATRWFSRHLDSTR